MMRSDNIILRSQSCFVRNRTMVLCSAYNVNVMSMSEVGVKNAIRTSFTSLLYKGCLRNANSLFYE